MLLDEVSFSVVNSLVTFHSRVWKGLENLVIFILWCLAYFVKEFDKSFLYQQFVDVLLILDKVAVLTFVYGVLNLEFTLLPNAAVSDKFAGIEGKRLFITVGITEFGGLQVW